MAVAQVHQREIVEVPFTLPDGQILPHPALVLSCDDLQNVEPGMFYAVLISSKNHYPQLTIPIQNDIILCRQCRIETAEDIHIDQSERRCQHCNKQDC